MQVESVSDGYSKGKRKRGAPAVAAASASVATASATSAVTTDTSSADVAPKSRKTHHRIVSTWNKSLRPRGRILDLALF